MPEPSFTFRSATESDRTYLQRLNFLADVYGDETTESHPDVVPGVAQYVDAWNPLRDGGVIAFDSFRTPAGGVWLRYWDDPAHGHANLGPEVPELAIAVENRYAGHQLGQQLLDRAVELARTQGAQRVALSVAATNPRARHRYETFGFVDSPGIEGAMVFEL